MPHTYAICWEEWDSVAHMLTVLWARKLKNKVSTPSNRKSSLVFAKFPDWFWGRLSPLFNGYRWQRRWSL